jgi:hypothetical protein
LFASWLPFRRSRARLATVALAGALAAAVGIWAQEWSEGNPVHGVAGAPRAAACPPPYDVIRAPAPSAATLRGAKQGDFEIHETTAHLVPPVNWESNPQNAQAYRHQLEKLQWINPLLYAYQHGDRSALRQTLALVLDWVRHNQPGAPGTPPDAWRDARTGDRAPYIAYVLNAAGCEHMLTPAQGRLLRDSIRQHGRVLLTDSGIKRTNHGLFVDLGLTLLAREAPFMHQARRWLRAGQREFARTLRGRIYPREGFWLEQSAGYQLLVMKNLARFLAVPGNANPGLQRILRRMQRTSGWLQMPDGRIPQFGDSDLNRLPASARRTAAADRGMLVLRRSGYAFVKEPGAYLSVEASFHNTSHKHADDLSFDLYDRGHRIVSDTGLYSKDPGPAFDFAHSAKAHSVLTVDGQNFPLQARLAYGSGILAAGSGDGWFAIYGRNPLLRSQGVTHHRLFLYRPHRALIVIDQVRSAIAHAYDRFFQLGPDLHVRRSAAGLSLSAGGFAGSLTATSSSGPERLTTVKGQKHHLAGLTSPRFRVWIPRWTARYWTSGADSNQVAAFDLASTRPLRVRLGTVCRRRIDLCVGGLGGPPTGLGVGRRGGSLSVHAGRCR